MTKKWTHAHDNLCHDIKAKGNSLRDYGMNMLS